MSPDLEPATVTRLRPAGMSDVPEDVPLAGIQGTLALDLGRPASPVPPELHVVERDARGDGLSEWAARFAQALVEVLGGDRPVAQLLKVTSPQVYDELTRRTRILARARGVSPKPVSRLQVRTVRICRPCDQVAELCVHVRHGQRSRALAARLETRDGRWQCTAVQFG